MLFIGKKKKKKTKQQKKQQQVKALLEQLYIF